MIGACLSDASHPRHAEVLILTRFKLSCCLKGVPVIIYPSCLCLSALSDPIAPWEAIPDDALVTSFGGLVLFWATAPQELFLALLVA